MVSPAHLRHRGWRDEQAAESSSAIQEPVGGFELNVSKGGLYGHGQGLNVIGLPALGRCVGLQQYVV